MTKTWKFEKGPVQPAYGFPWFSHRTLEEIDMKMPANAKTIEAWRARNEPDDAS